MHCANYQLLSFRLKYALLVVVFGVLCEFSTFDFQLEVCSARCRKASEMHWGHPIQEPLGTGQCYHSIPRAALISDRVYRVHPDLWAPRIRAFGT